MAHSDLFSRDSSAQIHGRHPMQTHYGARLNDGMVSRDPSAYPSSHHAFGPYSVPVHPEKQV